MVMALYLIVAQCSHPQRAALIMKEVCLAMPFLFNILVVSIQPRYLKLFVNCMRWLSDKVNLGVDYPCLISIYSCQGGLGKK
jgi:hypothetical protein